jgi:hypothetical protein
MSHSLPTLVVSVCLGLAAAASAGAADAAASSPAMPATGVRVGGSPADAEFRAAQQKSGAEYRAARAACPKQPAPERAACIKAARDTLVRERTAAAAAHKAKK